MFDKKNDRNPNCVSVTFPATIYRQLAKIAVVDRISMSRAVADVVKDAMKDIDMEDYDEEWAAMTSKQKDKALARFCPSVDPAPTVPVTRPSDDLDGDNPQSLVEGVDYTVEKEEIEEDEPEEDDNPDEDDGADDSDDDDQDDDDGADDEGDD